MGIFIFLIIALVLDAVFGEPDSIWKKIPHPVRVMGQIIKYADTHYNVGNNKRQKGLVALIIGCLIFFIFGWMVYLFPFSWFFEILIVAIFLSHKSLIEHVKDVIASMQLSIMEGRLAVSKIVGRDTTAMEERDIARAAIESTAESMLDGVISPAFWYLVGGLPGILVYKLVNTADSMIGHKNEKHGEFGWATAKFDDILNFIPARLSAFIIGFSHFSWHTVRFAIDQGNHHRSLNAGWPEAAFAKIMGIALSGPRVYNGQMVDYPYINASGRKELTKSDIHIGLQVAWRTWFGLCFLILFLEVLFLRFI